MISPTAKSLSPFFTGNRGLRVGGKAQKPAESCRVVTPPISTAFGLIGTRNVITREGLANPKERENHD